MNTLINAFNEVILSYDLPQFTAEEFSQITEVFHNMTETDVRNMAEEYAREIITYNYETMHY